MKKIPLPVDALVDLVEKQKLTLRVVAEMFGVSDRTIRKRCQELGIQIQRRGPRSGPGHPRWRGGVTQRPDGYILRLCPSHPHAQKKYGHVFEHRLVMEKNLGRLLSPGEVVHHRNGDRSDNRIENLMLFGSNGEHLKHEWSLGNNQRMLAGAAKGRSRMASIRDARRCSQTTDRSTDKPASNLRGT